MRRRRTGPCLTNFGLFSQATDEGSNFLRKVGNDLPDRAASYSKVHINLRDNFKSREINMCNGLDFYSQSNISLHGHLFHVPFWNVCCSYGIVQDLGTNPLMKQNSPDGNEIKNFQNVLFFKRISSLLLRVCSETQAPIYPQ